MNFEIGKKIKKYRLEKNLSQKKFADLIGVSSSRISNWELGINRPDVDMLSIICQVLQISANLILDIHSSNHDLSAQEQALFANYNLLNTEGKEKIASYISDLVSSGNYIKNNKSEVLSKKA